MKQKIIDFVTGVNKEMKKVTWPTKDDLKESTYIVIVVVLLFAAFTYLIDMVVAQLLKGLF
ncbi:preprotein translocase subunit SecE [bacterium BMS3Abin04]|nr:preprotein translocase subunit SecE [bacterium BMS3Abin04]